MHNKKTILEAKHLMSSFEINTKIISRQENNFIKVYKKDFFKEYIKIMNHHDTSFILFLIYIY